MATKAFITGSYAYGVPRPDSDIDLVVLGDPELKAFLTAHSDQEKTILFGGLNVICCTTVEEYELWRDGLTAAKREIPCATDRAKEILDLMRVDRGLEAEYDRRRESFEGG